MGGAPGVGLLIWIFRVSLSVLERRVGINDGISGLNLKKYNKNSNLGEFFGRCRPDQFFCFKVCQNDLQAFPKGYDRGHLASSATFDSSVEVNSETFLATNLVPQRKELNRGLWRELEQKVRDLSDQTGSVTVITGPIFPEYGRVVEGGVQIPSEFYKIIYVEAVETSFTFLIPNSRRLSRNLGTYLKSIDEIEALTGLKFLEVNTITQYSDGEWSEFKQLLQ